MFRVWCVASFLSLAACISSPEVTLVDGVHAAPVSLDGSAESIALAEELDLDAGAAPTDGGALPHPQADASADAQPPDDPDDDRPGNGKGKPPKKND